MPISPTSSGLLVSQVDADDASCSPSIVELLEAKVSAEILQAEVDQKDVEAVQKSSHSAQLSLQGEFKIFVSTFLTIFLAELGDKTQLTTLLMSAESQSPWVVFVGAGAALVLTSLLGVLLGHWLAAKVSPKTLEIASGSILLLISIMLFYDVLQG